MTKPTHKQYYPTARRGIKGEAFFESIIVDHAIPHRIARQNDLGVDFLCEWTCGDRPTGILFSAQVKSTTITTMTPEPVGTSPLKHLDRYRLAGAAKVDERTIDYWKGLGFPAYLFVVVEDESVGEARLSCYYKRYTAMLDGHANDDDQDGSQAFFKANRGSSFCAYADVEREAGGFARDLVIDYARLSYFNGHVLRLTPAQLGFWPFVNEGNPESERIFGEIVGWNRDKIQATCEWTWKLLDQLASS